MNRLVNQLEGLEKKGLKNNHDFLKQEIEYISKFRAPEKEIKEIRKLEQKLLADGVDIEKKFSERNEIRFMSLGRNSARKMKKNCYNIDNRKPPLINSDSDENAQTNRTRNQDSLGWCYAFAAADLLSYETGHEISAVDIANAHNDGKFSKIFLRKDESELESGYVHAAVKAALERGLCLEEQVKSDDYHFSNYFNNLKKELEATEDLYRLYEEKTSDPRAFWGRSKKEGHELDEAISEFRTDLQCREIESEWEQLFPGLVFEELMQTLSSASSVSGFVDELIEKSCRPRLRPGSEGLRINIKTLSSHSLFTNKSDLFDKVDEELERDKISSISYMSDVLYNRHKSEDGAHAGTIVAREFNESTGSCEYLVRNTYGTACTGYDPQYSCEEGNIWIPREYLERATFRTSYVE